MRLQDLIKSCLVSVDVFSSNLIKTLGNFFAKLEHGIT